MSLIKRMRKQDAVWWAVTGQNASGENLYDAPIQVKCRWEDVAEQFTDATGNVVISNARVYVDRIMKVGDVLWKGTLADIVYQVEPLRNEGAYAIRKFPQIPNLRNSETLLEAKL